MSTATAQKASYVITPKIEIRIWGSSTIEDLLGFLKREHMFVPPIDSTKEMPVSYAFSFSRKEADKVEKWLEKQGAKKK